MTSLAVIPSTEQKIEQNSSTLFSAQESLPRFTFNIPVVERLFQRSVTVNLLLDYKKYMVASNVRGQILKARIIYLLQPHKNNSFESLFNKTLIENLYQPGDRVLLERDSSAQISDEQVKSSIGLDASKYSISGWDAPGPIAKFRKEGRNWTWKEIEAFTISTWKERQDSLFACTKRGLSRIYNNRVFVVMGGDHAVNDDPRKNPRAIDFLATLEYPWTIVEPRKPSSARL